MDEFVELKNKGVIAKIALKGAELFELKITDKPSVLWEKDDAIWNRTSPNLFPIVGRLLNDSYAFKGQTYQMSQHGFARDNQFTIKQQSTDFVELTLRWSEETLLIYPFKFELSVCYNLAENGINITYIVRNLDDKTLGFSVGGHPGFELSDSLDHYKLVFSNPFESEQHELVGPYYSGEKKSFLCAGEIQLNDKLFENDALVFKKPPFEWVALTHISKGQLVKLTFDELDAIGFWTKKDAPFFCIEPWWGWADELNHTGDFLTKAGLYWLEIGQKQDFMYSIVLP